MRKTDHIRITSWFAAASMAAIVSSECGGRNIFASQTDRETAMTEVVQTESAPMTESVQTRTATEPETAQTEYDDASGIAEETEAAGTREYTDDLGRTVVLENEPERVAALIGSFADIWILAGGEESLAATSHDAWTSFDMNLGEDVEDLGSAKDISLEKLLASEPDLVIGSTSTGVDMELLPVLEETGIPTLYFDVDSFEDYLRMLKLCTEITGETENYQTYGEGIQEQVDNAIAMQDGSNPSVLYIRATGSSFKSKGSEGSVLGEMLEDLGCVNIADSDESLLENLSMEAILAADPDHIFIVYQGTDTQEAEDALEEGLFSNPAWETLTAVKEGRVHVMSHQMFNLKPNAQWGDAYEIAAEILYGDDTAGQSEVSSETESGS